MKSFYIPTTLYVATILFVSACTKPEDKKEEPLSPKKQLLVNGKWQIAGSTIIVKFNGKDTTLDMYSGWRACEQDDFSIFYADGTGVANDGPDKCPEDNQENKFTWELLDNETKLKVSIGSQAQTADIIEITASQMKVKGPDTINSLPGYYIETYKNIQ